MYPIDKKWLEMYVAFSYLKSDTFIYTTFTNLSRPSPRFCVTCTHFSVKRNTCLSVCLGVAHWRLRGRETELIQTEHSRD